MATPFTGFDSSSYLKQSARFLCLQMYSVQKRPPKDCLSAYMDFTQQEAAIVVVWSTRQSCTNYWHSNWNFQNHLLSCYLHYWWDCWHSLQAVERQSTFEYTTRVAEPRTSTYIPKNSFFVLVNSVQCAARFECYHRSKLSLRLNFHFGCRNEQSSSFSKNLWDR